MRRFAISIPLFLCASGALRAQDPAEAAIAEAKAALEDAKLPDEDRVLAVRRLATHPQPRVLQALQPWLQKGPASLRIAAAGVVATFRAVPGAGRSVAAAYSSPANRGPEFQGPRIRLLQALGELGADDGAGVVALALLDADPWIARAAAGAAAKLRNRSSIDPLIRRLAKLETPEADRKIPDGTPVVESVPDPSGYGTRDPKRRANGEEGREGREPEARRAERQILKAPILAALASITREEHACAATWAAWWARVRSDYRVPR